MISVDLDRAVAQKVAQYYADPLGFVLGCYRWPINGESGPDGWQRDILEDLGRQVRARRYNGIESVAPIRIAIASGHGIGKTALFAWIVNWLMSTRPHCRGTVTANTNDQLERRTWAGVLEWTSRCLTRHWFESNSTIFYRKGARATWNTAPQTCAPENAVAFQGQHAKGSTSFFIFDEASGIPDAIWDAAEGGLTDEPFILVGGQPLENTGRFYECCWGRFRERWTTRHIDSRECKLAPHTLIRQWLEDWGDEDSDFIRVRVRGLPPLASELQFIDGQRIAAAQKRVVESLPDEPLVAGVDVSGGGSAWTVIRFRRGLDARSVPPIRLTGEQTRDRARVVAILAEQFDRYPDLAAMFVDFAFGSAIVERLQATGYRTVYEVNFGGDSPDKHCANQRAFMWRQLKDWLGRGGIDPRDSRLEQDLGGPGYHLDRKGRLVIEPKESMIKRGLASPDDGDALALTFSQAVRMPYQLSRPRRGWSPVSQSWQG